MLMGIVATSVYFLFGNVVLLIFHTNSYGKGKIDVGDYIKWQWFWPLPVAYVICMGLVGVARKMAKKARDKE